MNVCLKVSCVEGNEWLLQDHFFATIVKQLVRSFCWIIICRYCFIMEWSICHNFFHFESKVKFLPCEQQGCQVHEFPRDNLVDWSSWLDFYFKCIFVSTVLIHLSWINEFYIKPMSLWWLSYLQKRVDDQGNLYSDWLAHNHPSPTCLELPCVQIN